MIIHGGISEKLDSRDTWSYNIVFNTWSKLNTVGNPPPLTEGASYISIPTRPQIFAYGGFLALSNTFNISRELYVLDIPTLSWARLPNAPIPLWGATASYNGEMNSLVFVGGYRWSPMSQIHRVLYFNLDSKEWYYGPNQLGADSVAYAAAVGIPGVNNDLVVGWGGLTSDTINARSTNFEPGACFSQRFQVLDLACGRMYLLNSTATSSSALRRRGHSMVLRNDTLFVLGGTNGFVLSDLVELRLPQLNLSSIERDKCRANNWCGSNYYGCLDCIAKPYCSWCAEQCVWDLSKRPLLTMNTSSQAQHPNISLDGAVCSALGGLGTVEKGCKPLIPFQIGTSLVASIMPKSTVDMSVYIDIPTFDIEFALSTPSTNIPPLNLSLLSIRSLSPSTASASSPASIKLLASDPRRYSGPYNFRISNEGGNESVPFSIAVNINDAQTGGGGGQGGFGFWSSAIDLTTFITVFALCVLVSLTLAVVVKRIRDRMASAAGGAPMGFDNSENREWLQRDPPTLWKVLVQVDRQVSEQEQLQALQMQKEKEVHNQSQPPEPDKPGGKGSPWLSWMRKGRRNSEKIIPTDETSPKKVKEVQPPAQRDVLKTASIGDGESSADRMSSSLLRRGMNLSQILQIPKRHTLQ
ncbi:hypothetical protein HDV05_005061 [Chytridiales sp. JEL 0842]|nr:hypothetical protein HDV05_005061 [Chytridiales sp. JEL 0842]